MFGTKKFKNVALMGHPRKDNTANILLALIDYLQQRKLNVCIEANTAELLPTQKLPTTPGEQLGQHCELIIVVGGDGSILNTAHWAVEQELAVLGINQGRLGFLTDIYPKELEKVAAVLDGDYRIEDRFMLHAHIICANENIAQQVALNDVVLFPSEISHMIEFDVIIDQQFLCTYRADGLITTTPTGSTAHALSAGGPILHPQLNAIGLVPLAPHTLTSRPLIIDAKSDIEIKVSENNLKPACVSCDGQKRIGAPQGSIIKIKKNDKLLKLVHPTDYTYFDTLRNKLHWKG